MAPLKKTRRGILMADTHCGHRVGLTPPDWQGKNINVKWDRTQMELWGLYEKMVKKYSPIDFLLIPGDCVEGKGTRSGGTELITTDRGTQAEMAAQCIALWKCPYIVMTYGTSYHTGVSEDWEDAVARHPDVKAKKIGGEEWININGTTFNIKHYISNTSVPYTKGTPLARERIWNMIWSEHEEAPKSDVIVRAHVHNFFYTGDNNFLGMTLPALQGLGSKFGTRIPSTHVDFGLVFVQVEKDGSFSWRPDIVRGKTQKVEALTL